MCKISSWLCNILLHNVVTSRRIEAGPWQRPRCHMLAYNRRKRLHDGYQTNQIERKKEPRNWNHDNDNDVHLEPNLETKPLTKPYPTKDATTTKLTETRTLESTETWTHNEIHKRNTRTTMISISPILVISIYFINNNVLDTMISMMRSIQ